MIGIGRHWRGWAAFLQWSKARNLCRHCAVRFHSRTKGREKNSNAPNSSEWSNALILANLLFPYQHLMQTWSESFHRSISSKLTKGHCVVGEYGSRNSIIVLSGNWTFYWAGNFWSPPHSLRSPGYKWIGIELFSGCYLTKTSWNSVVFLSTTQTKFNVIPPPPPLPSLPLFFFHALDIGFSLPIIFFKNLIR